MTDRPILFSAPMVRALLAGTKTQTRRVVKPQPHEDRRHRSVDAPDKFVCPGEHTWWSGNHTQGIYHSARCPYGQPGDRLWVRETHYAWGHWTKRFNAKKGREEWHFVDETLGAGMQYRYEASERLPRRKRELHEVAWWKWPAIFMLRKACRITLEVTSVRVERLQDISEADAQAEGVYTDPACPAYDAYAQLWDEINGPESWAANPWVWAVSFKVVKGGAL